MTTPPSEIDLDVAIRSPETRANPYPYYDSLRNGGRVHTTRFGSLVVHRHDDVTAVLRDNRLSSSNSHNDNYKQFSAMARQLGFGALIDMQERTMLFLDPPDHTRLRRLAGKAFTVRAVEAMRSYIAELVDGMLDEADRRGRFDLISDVAYPLPVTVISQMMGVPLEDRDQLREWTAVAVRVLDPSDDMAALVPAGQAVEQLRQYFDDLVARRRSNLSDDLLSALIAAEEEGERLSHGELLATCVLLYAAGFETTVNLIGNGMLALLNNRPAFDRLGAEPELAASATEEALRYDSPVQLTGRTASEEVDVAGARLERGQEVLLILGAANRDPSAFDEPDAFDIGRTPNRHLAFSSGIHTCLGAGLARVEAQVAFTAIARRFPQLEVDGEPVRRATITLRGLESFPVRVVATSS
jgi:cytochrome P450